MQPRQILVWSLWLLMLCISLAISGCDGDGGDDQPFIGGTYRGTIQDSSAGAGTVIATIAQDGEDLSGTWQSTFSNPASNNGGTLTGTLNDPSITLTLNSSVPTACPFNLTGTLVGQTRVTGTYAAFNCSRPITGTIDVTRQ